jgi:tetratricopeptide (TPR) repeat protein
MENHSSAASPSPASRIRPHLPLVSLLALTFMVYIRVAGFSFVWDDTEFIVNNTALRSVGAVPSYFTDIMSQAAPSMAEQFRVYRPVRNISYLIDYHLFGLDPAGWHIHNLLIHLANGTLLYVFALLLTGSRTGAGVAAAVFLLHPVQTEAVAWVKCRDDLLSVFFVLTAVVLALRNSSPPGIAAVHGLACLAKAQALAVIPVFLWFRPQAGRRARLLALAALGVSLVYLGVRHVVLGGSGQGEYLAGSFGKTLLQMGPVVLHYIRLILWPGSQLADYIHQLSHPVDVLPALAAWGLLILLAALFFWWSRTQPVFRLAGVLFMAALLPVMNLVPMMQYMAERFLYLPMVGVALAAGFAVAALHRKKQTVAWSLAGILVAAMLWQTHLRLPVWENEVTLFTSVVEDAPYPSYRPRKNLLSAYLKAGLRQEAGRLSREMLEEDWADDLRATLLLMRARAMKLNDGAPEKIREHLEEAVQLAPADVQVLSDLGISHAQSGNTEQAVLFFSRAIESDPSDALLYRNRAIAYQQSGRPALAEVDFRKSLEIEPRRQTFLFLASLLWSQERYKDAQAVYRSGLEVFPTDQEMLKWFKRAARRAER